MWVFGTALGFQSAQIAIGIAYPFHLHPFSQFPLFLSFRLHRFHHRDVFRIDLSLRFFSLFLRPRGLRFRQSLLAASFCRPLFLLPCGSRIQQSFVSALQLFEREFGLGVLLRAMSNGQASR